MTEDSTEVQKGPTPEAQEQIDKTMNRFSSVMLVGGTAVAGIALATSPDTAPQLILAQLAAGTVSTVGLRAALNLADEVRSGRASERIKNYIAKKGSELANTGKGIVESRPVLRIKTFGGEKKEKLTAEETTTKLQLEEEQRDAAQIELLALRSRMQAREWIDEHPEFAGKNKRDYSKDKTGKERSKDDEAFGFYASVIEGKIKLLDKASTDDNDRYSDVAEGFMLKYSPHVKSMIDRIKIDGRVRSYNDERSRTDKYRFKQNRDTWNDFVDHTNELYKTP